jgi:hypothetical protein
MNSDAESRLAALDHNYGNMGTVYSKYLATNLTRIKQELIDKCNEIQTRMGGGETERYWYTLVALLTCAARYARDLGVDVDENEIEHFMCRVYRENEDQRKLFADAGGGIDITEDVLTRYLKERDAGERGIWTDHMHIGKGRPSRPVILLRGPHNSKNLQGGIEFRFAARNKLLVIARKDFTDWMAAQKYEDMLVINSLKYHYGMESGRLRLLSGYMQDAGRESCLALHIRPRSALWDYMLSGCNPELRTELEASEDGPIQKIIMDDDGDTDARHRSEEASLTAEPDSLG